MACALDNALALFDNPGLRQQLRDSPLPEQVEQVLRLATGSQPLLDDTAARLDQSPGMLVEASRFYLQQVLLEPGNNPYRVLGVHPDAPTAQIRKHHRLLQHWLHPDRAGADWQVLFAPRVNWAWKQLRSDQARLRYHTRLNSAAEAVNELEQPGPETGLPQWQATPVRRSMTTARLLRGAVLGVMALVCMGLFTLAWQRTRHQHVPTVISPASIVATSRDTHTNANWHTMPQHDDEALLLQPLPSPRPTQPLTAVMQIQAPAARPSRNPTPQSLQIRPILASYKPAVISTTTNPATQPEDAPSVARQVTPAANHHSAANATDFTPNPPQAPTNSPTQLATASHSETPTRQPEPSHLPPLPEEQLLDRINRARQQLRELVSYFRREQSNMSRWADPVSSSIAVRQRQQLQNRHGDSADTFILREPLWQTDGRQLTVHADYLVGPPHASIERGKFRLTMTWNDRLWRIVKLELEPGS